MWGCSKCKRTFKHETNYHSCVQVTEEELLAKAGDKILAANQKIKKAVMTFADVQVNCSKSGIYYKNGSSFLAITPSKETMNIESILPREINESLL